MNEENRKMGRLRRWMTGTLVFLLVTFALAEIGARVWLYHFADDEAFSACCSVPQFLKYGEKLSRFKSHPYLGFVLNPGNRRGGNNVNSQGYRGGEFAMPKPADEFRIVCMGGSTTYDDCVPNDAETYPARLQQHLRDAGYNVTVVNAGVPGWTSYESLINYALRISYIEPNLLLINDAWNDLSMRLVYPTGAYKGDGTGAKTGTLYAFPWYEQFTCVRIPLLLAGKMLPHLWTALNHPAKSFVAYDFPHGPTFQKTTLGAVLEQNRPTFFENNLKKIVAMANSQKVAALLLTFPFSRTPEAFQGCFGINPEDAGVYEQTLHAFDEMNASIKSVAADTGAPVFDLAGAFPQSKDYNELYADGFHNNPAGADVKAKLIKDFVVSSALIPDAYKLQTR